jgi:hypothetical protein
LVPSPFDDHAFCHFCCVLLSLRPAVVNTVTNRVMRLLCKDKSVCWMNLSLYQGVPAKKGVTTVAMAASANPILVDKVVHDPTLFCTALKRQWFYMFMRSEPECIFSSFFFCTGIEHRVLKLKLNRWLQWWLSVFTEMAAPCSNRLRSPMGGKDPTPMAPSAMITRSLTGSTRTTR